jgi:plastocyanin
MVAIVVAIAFGAVACGDDEEDTAGGAGTVAETAPAPAEETGAGTETAPKPGGAAPRAAKVEIVDFAFDPPTARIQAGGKVTWLNQDAAAHTASGQEGSFDTGTIDQGKLQAETFKRAGTYSYICAFHPYMEGTVEVVE